MSLFGKMPPVCKICRRKIVVSHVKPEGPQNNLYVVYLYVSNLFGALAF